MFLVYQFPQNIQSLEKGTLKKTNTQSVELNLEEDKVKGLFQGKGPNEHFGYVLMFDEKQKCFVIEKIGFAITGLRMKTDMGSLESGFEKNGKSDAVKSRKIKEITSGGLREAERRERERKDNSNSKVKKREREETDKKQSVKRVKKESSSKSSKKSVSLW